MAATLGDFESSGGALLLFITNVLAIVAAGGLMFVLTGVAGASGPSRATVGNWVVAFSLESWGEPYGYELESITIVDDVVTVVVAGETAPDDETAAELREMLIEPLGSLTLVLETDLIVSTTVDE